MCASVAEEMGISSVREEQESALDIEQEYNNTLRMRSNARFLSNKQRCEEEMEAFLQTQQQELVRNLMTMHRGRRSSSEMELAIVSYFDASAEASEICVELLRNIRSTRSNYQSMDLFLASLSEGGGGTASTSAAGALPRALNNPFCTTLSNFRQIHGKNSSMFRSIRSSHRKVARKLKVVKAFDKLLKACRVGAAKAVHLMFFGLMAGTTAAAAGLCSIALRKQMTKKKTRSSSSKTAGSLLLLRDQLDAAAKGTYVLGRDLDTVSQLVARLSDGIERENAMVMCCVERASEGSSPVMEMVSELKRSCSSSRRIAEELEEHVCLCLATIHRAGVLVIREISKSIDHLSFELP